MTLEEAKQITNERKAYAYGQLNILLENHRTAITHLEHAQRDMKESLQRLISLREEFQEIEAMEKEVEDMEQAEVQS